MKACILLSGHFRTGKQTYSSLKQKIILPLERYGYTVDIYFSVWDNMGNRSNDFDPNDKICLEELIDLYLPKKYEMEIFNRDYFRQRYPSNQWTDRYRLSGPDTFSDAVSQWYLRDRVSSLIKDEKYDFVFATRFDIEYLHDLNIHDLEQSLSGLSISKWDGLYSEVKQGCVDHIFFGKDVIKMYQLFKDIPKIYNDCIHTSEGMMASYLKNFDNVIRNDFRYSIVYSNGERYNYSAI